MQRLTWLGSILPSKTDAVTPAGPLTQAALIRARFFDGRSSQPVPCVLSLQAASKRITLHIHAVAAAGAPQALLRTFSGAQIDWPDAGETRIAIIRFSDGSHVQTPDSPALNAALRAAGYRPPGLHGLAAKMAGSWRALLAGVLVCGALTAAIWLVGVPAAADAITRLMPTRWDAELGARTLAALDNAWLQPSRLPAAKQAQVQADFAALIAKAWPDGSAPPYQLHFRSLRMRSPANPDAKSDAKPEIKPEAGSETSGGSSGSSGANAFALPGGALVMTDELVALAEPAALLGVLAHELGHVQRRHATRMAVQSALLGAAVAVISGDPTSVLATVPVALATLDFSRRHEVEADCFALQTLARAGENPESLARLLETITKGHSSHAGVLSSHPSTPERVQLLRDAAAAQSVCQF